MKEQTLSDLVTEMRGIALYNSYDPEQRMVPECCSQVVVIDGQDVRLTFSHSEFASQKVPSFYSLTLNYESREPMPRDLSDHLIQAFFPEGITGEVSAAANPFLSVTNARQVVATTKDRARRRV